MSEIGRRLTSYRRQKAREIRELRFPQQLAEIEKRGYQHPECLAAFLDVCDELVFDDPARAIAVTPAAPPYADRLFAAGGGGSLRLWAHAVVGSACLAVGRLEEAEAAFAAAAACDADADEHAALACRLAHLRSVQQRWPQAFRAAERAVRHFEQRYDPDRPERETDRLSLAMALVTRGNVSLEGFFFGCGNLQSAAQDFATALTVCTRATDRARLSALQNLGSVAAAAWIGGEPSPLHPSQVFESMRQLRRTLHRQKKIRHRSVLHARIRWLMGLALAQESMGLTRRAENYLRGARDDLIALGSYLDAAMISLDFGWWLLEERRWPTLRVIADELVTAPWAHRLPAEWREALRLWRQGIAARHFDRERLARVYETVRGIRVEVPARVERRHRWSTQAGW